MPPIRECGLMRRDSLEAPRPHPSRQRGSYAVYEPIEERIKIERHAGLVLANEKACGEAAARSAAMSWPRVPGKRSAGLPRG